MVAYYYVILYLSRKGTVFIGSVEALPHESSLLPSSTHRERERMYAREEKHPHRESLRCNGDCIPPLYCPPSQPILKAVALEPYFLFRVLRHRRPAPRYTLSKEIHKPFALSRVFLLSSGGKSVLLVKKKAPSRSGFSASTHVVLKTRYVNPNIHVRRY